MTMKPLHRLKRKTMMISMTMSVMKTILLMMMVRADKLRRKEEQKSKEIH